MSAHSDLSRLHSSSASEGEPGGRGPGPASACAYAHWCLDGTCLQAILTSDLTQGGTEHEYLRIELNFENLGLSGKWKQGHSTQAIKTDELSSLA